LNAILHDPSLLLLPIQDVDVFFTITWVWVEF